MIRFFIDKPKLVILMSLILILAGAFSMLNLRKESYPVVDFAQAKITTIYPGATPEDVEELVTQKIEDELREIDGLKEVRSVSQQGLSEIKIKVDLDNANVKDVMDELQRAAARVTDLPDEIDGLPKFEEIKTKNMPVLEVSLYGELPELTLRTLVDQLEDIVESIPGVAGVDKVGYRDREFRVFLNPEHMRTHHISFQEVIAAIQDKNIDLPGGILESQPHEMTVRTMGEIATPDDLLDVVLRTNLSGKIVFLKDVATIGNAFEEPQVLTRTNLIKSMVLVVKKKEMADIIDLSAAVKSQLEIFRKSLPDGANIVVSNDESIRTVRRLDIMISNAVIGLTLILIALLLFLNWRMAILTSLSMPIVVMGTIVGMQFLGITFNLISMLAIIIALGMFVDNSIVVSENIHRFQEEGLDIKSAAYKGVKTIIWPVTATVMTTIAAFAPMMVTKGIMGEFIWSIPVLVSISLLICLAESFFLLPSRIVVFESKRRLEDEREKKTHWFEKLQSRFEKILQLAIRHKWKSVLIANALLVLSVLWAIFMMDFILFPPEGVDRIVFKYEAAPGTPIDVVHDKIQRVERTIVSLPKKELESFITRTGVQQTTLSDPLARTGDNIGMITIYLTPETQRDRTAQEIVNELRNTTLQMEKPFVSFQMEQLVNGPPVGKPVTITILGRSLTKMEAISKEIGEFLKNQDGVFDIDSDNKTGLEQVRINLKPHVTEVYGITTADIAYALRTAYEGVIASTVTQFGDEIDIRVQLNNPQRGNRDSLKRLAVSDGKGHLIPLSELANMTITPGPSQRRHLDFLRAITITADVNLDKTTSVEINTKLRKQFSDLSQRYPGYSIKFGGEEESTQESMQSLSAAMIIAILCIYAILVTLFNSLSKPALVMFAIPFGFIGTIIGFSIHQKPLGFFAMIGIIGLAGVFCSRFTSQFALWVCAG